jgi:hypothetical protein
MDFEAKMTGLMIIGFIVIIVIEFVIGKHYLRDDEED